MAALRTSALSTWPDRLGCALLLLVSLSLGCVDLSKPRPLAHPGGSTAGLPAGGSAASTGAGGSGTEPYSSGGTGGTNPAGGSSGGIPVDAGLGGSTIPSSSALDAQSVGGNTEIDAPADQPQSTGGVVFDGGSVGSGGSAGQTGVAGGTGTRLDAGSDGPRAGTIAGQTGGNTGTWLDAAAGGSVIGGTGGAGGTAGTGGAVGQDGSVAEVRDAPPVLDTSSPDSPCALCAIGSTLVHRYNFNGSGTTVTDSVGTAHGTVKNAQLSGSGTAVLAGGTSDQYIDFPDRIFSTLTSATLEIWVTWTGGGNNQRILDFGSNEQSGSSYYAVTTVIISPNSVINGTARLRTSFSSDVSAASTFVDATSTLATGAMQQIVAVFDGQSHTLAMYLNGVLQAQVTGLGALSLINDNNNYLGKSQYTADPGFAGTYHEFRIYNAPLTAAQVQAVYAAGTSASFTQ
jgi:hypothetical protein